MITNKRPPSFKSLINLKAIDATVPVTGTRKEKEERSLIRYEIINNKTGKVYYCKNITAILRILPIMYISRNIIRKYLVKNSNFKLGHFTFKHLPHDHELFQSHEFVNQAVYYTVHKGDKYIGTWRHHVDIYKNTGIKARMVFLDNLVPYEKVLVNGYVLEIRRYTQETLIPKTFDADTKFPPIPGYGHDYLEILKQDPKHYQRVNTYKIDLVVIDNDTGKRRWFGETTDLAIHFGDEFTQVLLDTIIAYKAVRLRTLAHTFKLNTKDNIAKDYTTYSSVQILKCYHKSTFKQLYVSRNMYKDANDLVPVVPTNIPIDKNVHTIKHKDWSIVVAFYRAPVTLPSVITKSTELPDVHSYQFRYKQKNIILIDN